MSGSLSIVLPIYNGASSVEATIEAGLAAADASPFAPVEVVVVDDGSTDRTPAILRDLATRRPVRVLRQPHEGPFSARHRGVREAAGEWVLTLDSHLALDGDSLSWVAERARDAPGARLWNGHCRIETAGNRYGSFWKVLTEGVWPAYFRHPRTISFDAREFDRYPKGTGHFLAPRQLLLEAMESFTSRFADGRYQSDDTKLLRWLAEREPINISPSFGSQYSVRRTLPAFLQHAMGRGARFVDSHLEPGMRFFPYLVAFYPASIAALLIGIRKPGWVVPGLAATAGGAALYAARERAAVRDGLWFSALVVPWGAAFSAGLWHGVWLLAARRLRS